MKFTCIKQLLTLLVALALAACVSTDTATPRVEFQDRPSSFAPSGYRAGATAERQTVPTSSGFYAANEAASARGGQEIAEMRARRAEAAAVREAEWRAAGSPISCPHCNYGSIYHEGVGLFTPGWTTVCPYCHGTGKVSAVR
jgi:hypothetical protein